MCDFAIQWNGRPDAEMSKVVSVESVWMLRFVLSINSTRDAAFEWKSSALTSVEKDY